MRYSEFETKSLRTLNTMALVPLSLIELPASVMMVPVAMMATGPAMQSSWYWMGPTLSLSFTNKWRGTAWLGPETVGSESLTSMVAVELSPRIFTVGQEAFVRVGKALMISARLIWMTSLGTAFKV